MTIQGTEPETGITPGGTAGAFKDVLAKDHARRGKPPVHLVDMDTAEREAAAKSIGMPRFRVKQLANHYFSPTTIPTLPRSPIFRRSRARLPKIRSSLNLSMKSHTKSPMRGQPSKPFGACSMVR